MRKIVVMGKVSALLAMINSSAHFLFFDFEKQVDY
jgi:hypothetical protein